MPSAAYVAMSRYLVALHRRDLLEPLASAYATIIRLAILIRQAEVDRDLDAARRLKAESMRQRARAEHAVHEIVEAIGDEGSELVAGLLGDDRTLAQILLDE
jgi:hypothetical protein